MRLEEWILNEQDITNIHAWLSVEAIELMEGLYVRTGAILHGRDLRGATGVTVLMDSVSVLIYVFFGWRLFGVRATSGAFIGDISDVFWG